MATFNPGTESSYLANQIAQLTRSGKSAGVSDILNLIETSTPKKKPDSSENELLSNRAGPIASSTTAKPKPITSLHELQKQKVQHDKDVKALQDDLKLLSALLGRPITAAEIPSLIGQVGKSTGPSTVSPDKSRNNLRSTEVTSTTPRTSTKPWTPPTILDTAKYMEATSTTAAYFGKSNEARIAEILKLQGIGPENNNLPVDVSEHLIFTCSVLTIFPLKQELLQQVVANPGKPISTPRTTTTRKTRLPPVIPSREPRPIIDGLQWLWGQWQATAPRTTRNKNVAAPGSYAEILNGAGSRAPTPADTGLDEDFSLDEDVESPPVLRPNLPSGGQLITAAIGVTRAISSFLGAALTVN